MLISDSCSQKSTLRFFYFLSTYRSICSRFICHFYSGSAQIVFPVIDVIYSFSSLVYVVLSIIIVIFNFLRGFDIHFFYMCLIDSPFSIGLFSEFFSINVYSLVHNLFKIMIFFLIIVSIFLFAWVVADDHNIGIHRNQQKKLNLFIGLFNCILICFFLYFFIDYSQANFFIFCSFFSFLFSIFLIILFGDVITMFFRVITQIFFLLYSHAFNQASLDLLFICCSNFRST